MLFCAFVSLQFPRHEELICRRFQNPAADKRVDGCHLIVLRSWKSLIYLGHR